MVSKSAQRVAFVADELLGYAGNGIGTTTTFVSLALARAGHDIEILFVGTAPSGPIEPEWQRLYDDANVRVRVVPRGEENVEPGPFARARDLEQVLRADPPDVVVVQDLGAPAYTSLRLRRLGLAFEQTTFIVFCHGTRQWITDVSRKVRVLPGAHAVTVLERASVELADAVVSPSAYLVDWMRGEGWQLPARTYVIPHVSRAGATGEPPPTPARRDSNRVERVAFFGRLEERKGVGPFLAALNTLEPELLERFAVEFIGRPTPPWPVERGNVAGIRELVATEDHARVLCEPTREGIGEALRRALNGDDELRPARPAFEDAESLRRWEDVLALPPDPFPPSPGRQAVDAVVVQRSSRSEALPALDGEWVLFLDEDDVPEPALVETLVRAQQVSEADVVTCGLFLSRGPGKKSIHLFPGEPRALGMLANGYGTVALVRRSLLEGAVAEADWPFLAGLSFAGAKIVSVPTPLVTRTAPPADVHSHPAEARLVLRHAERALPHELRLLAELGARLAADRQRVVPPRARGLARRAARRLLAGLGR